MELSVSTVCRAFQVIFSAFLFLSFGSAGLVRYAFRRSQPRSLARHSRSELGDRGWQRQSISHLWPFVGEVEGALVKLTVILSSRLFKQTVLVRASAPSPCSNIYSVITRWDAVASDHSECPMITYAKDAPFTLSWVVVVPRPQSEIRSRPYIRPRQKSCFVLYIGQAAAG